MIRPALLTLFVLVPLLPRPETPRFEPRAGTELRIAFESEVTAAIVSVGMTVDGAPHAGGPTPEMSVAVSRELVFLDRWETVDEGRLTRLTRTFEELAEERFETIAAHEGHEDRTLGAESDLEGRAVTFEWDPDAEEWTADSEDADADLLEGLAAEIGLRAFLPEDDVEEDEAWDVPASALRDAIAPGGDLKLELEESSGLPDVPLDELDGDIRATLSGTRDEDGAAVLAIELEIEVSAEHELPLDEGEEHLAVEYELEGELLWLADEGRFHALELSGDVTWTVVQRRTVEMGGREFETEHTIELAGDAEYRLEAEE